MSETIKDILLALILALVCGIGAGLLKGYKKSILATVASLVQKAENAVQGSGMGAEKKKLVIAQLEAAGVKVNAWLDKAIDDIVAQLNEKNAWFTENAKDGLSGTAVNK
jgi:hypothetical protein